MSLAGARILAEQRDELKGLLDGSSHCRSGSITTT